MLKRWVVGNCSNLKKDEVRPVKELLALEERAKGVLRGAWVVFSQGRKQQEQQEAAEDTGSVANKDEDTGSF